MEGIPDLAKTLSKFVDDGQLRETNDRFLAGLPARGVEEAELYQALINCYVLLGQVGVPEFMPMATCLNNYTKWWWDVWEETASGDEVDSFDEGIKSFLEES